jgi:hypothetical protein
MALLILRLLVPLLPVLAWILYRTLRYYRIEQLKDLPRLKPDLIWGHMKVVNEYITEMEQSRKGAHEGKPLRQRVYMSGRNFKVFSEPPRLSRLYQGFLFSWHPREKIAVFSASLDLMNRLLCA